MKFFKNNLSWSSLLLGLLIVGLLAFIWREAKKDDLSLDKKNVSGRLPASIEKSSDLSQLNGDTLVSAAKIKLLRNLVVDHSEGAVDIRLGNFVMLNHQQQKDFACGVYNHITLNFKAEGVAVNGERPTLTVQTPCTVGDNINSLEPIHIPYDQIKSQNTKTGEFVLWQQGQPLHLKSQHLPESWPTHWALSDITMGHDSNESQHLHITGAEIRKITNKPVYMNW